MKILIARLNHETNTFSPVPTPIEAFAPTYGEAAYSANKGMRTAMAAFIDPHHHRMVWSGARVSGFLLPSGSDEAVALSADRMGVGYTETPADYCWTRHETSLNPQDLLFIFTDGLTDQIGGERGIMFGKKRIKALLEQHRSTPVPELSDALMQAYLDWQGNQQRRDDMTFLGFRYCGL